MVSNVTLTYNLGSLDWKLTISEILTTMMSAICINIKCFSEAHGGYNMAEKNSSY